MQKILLSKGKYALVDDEDFEELNKHKWCADTNEGKGTYYARRHSDGPEYMHRVIMGLSRGDNIKVDHRDLNGLNNQKENLRVATHQQNCLNTGSRGGTSRYKGVWLHKGKYCASIMSKSKRTWLGCYPTEIEAAQAYDVAALKLHGEYAKLNFERKFYE